MSGGDINPTELTAAIINQKLNLIEGIRYAQEIIEGSLSFLILTPLGIYAARDRLGRTPLVIGQKEDACCVSFEDFAYLNLGYHTAHELGPGEIAIVTPEGFKTPCRPRKGNEILHLSLGLLWLSLQFLRGSERRKDALPYWRTDGSA